MSTGSLIDIIDSRVGVLAVPDVYMAYQDAAHDPANKSEYVFEGLRTGSEHPGRQLYFSVAAASSVDPPEAEVFGDGFVSTPCRLLGHATDGIRILSLFTVSLPVGDVVSLRITFPANALRVAAILHTALGVLERVPNDIQTFSDGGQGEAPLYAPSGSVVLASSLSAPTGGIQILSTALRAVPSTRTEHPVTGEAVLTDDGTSYVWHGVSNTVIQPTREGYAVGAHNLILTASIR